MAQPTKTGCERRKNSEPEIRAGSGRRTPTAEQRERFPTEWAMYSEDQSAAEQSERQIEDDRPGRRAAVSSVDAAGRAPLRQTLRASGSGSAA